MLSEFFYIYKYISGCSCECNEAADYFCKYFSHEDHLINVNQGAFSLFLSKVAFFNKLSLRYIDVWTKLFDRHNFLRYKLNCAVALIETTTGAHWKIVNISNSIPRNLLSIFKLILNYVVTCLFAFIYVFVLYFFWRLSRFVK